MSRFFSKRKSMDYLVDKLEIGKIDVQDPDVKLQLHMIGITIEDLAYAPCIQKILERDDHLLKMAEAFYSGLFKVEKIKNLVNQYSSVDRLKQTLQRHIFEMFSGVINDDYLAKRLRIAKTHYRIGLEPKWYMASFYNLIDYILYVLETNVQDHVLRKKFNELTLKLLNFEQQLVLELYEQENIRERESQYLKVKEEIKQKVAGLSEDLAALSEETSATVQEISSASSEVTLSVNSSVQQSKKTKDQAIHGKERVESISEHMSTVLQNMSSLVSSVDQLANSSREIKGVITFVQEIAEQTNLLSLNSSIEAARAGEHGKGFAVVAQEVKNLSLKTKDSVKQIEKIITQSNQLTNQVVEAIEDIQRQITKCMEEIEKTYQSFTKMVAYIDQSIDEVSRVETEIHHLNLGIEMVEQAVTNVANSADTLNHSIQSF